MALQTIRCVAVAYHDDADEDDGSGGSARAVVFVARDSGVIEKYTSVSKAVRAGGSAAAAVVLRGHTRAVTALSAVDPDELYSCALDGAVRRWRADVRDEHADDAANKGASRVTQLVPLHTPLHCLARHRDGRLCVGGDDGRLFILDGTRQAAWVGHSEAVTCVAFSRDGAAVVTGSRDQQLRVWQSASGRCVRVLRGHTSMLRGVAVLTAPRTWSATLSAAFGGNNDANDEDGDEDGGGGGAAGDDYRQGRGRRHDNDTARALSRRWRAAHDVSDIDGAREVVVSFAADGNMRVWALPAVGDNDVDDDDANNNSGDDSSYRGDGSDEVDVDVYSENKDVRTTDAAEGGSHGANSDATAAIAAATDDNGSNNNNKDAARNVVSFALPERNKDADDEAANTQPRARDGNNNNNEGEDDDEDDEEGGGSAAVAAAAAAAAAVLPSVHEILHPSTHAKSALKKRTRVPYVRSAVALASFALPHTPLCVQSPLASMTGAGDEYDDEDDDDEAMAAAAAAASPRQLLQSLLCVGCVGGYVIALHTRLLARSVLREAAALLYSVRAQAQTHARVVQRRQRQLRQSCQQTIRAAEQRLLRVALRARKAERAAARQARRDAQRQARAAAKAAYDAERDDGDEEDEAYDEEDNDNDGGEDDDEDEEEEGDEDDEEGQGEEGGDDGQQQQRGAAARTARLQRLLTAEQLSELDTLRRDVVSRYTTQVRALYDALARDAARLAPFARHTHTYTREAFASLPYTTLAHVHSNSNGSSSSSRCAHGGVAAAAEDIVALATCHGHVYATQASCLVPVALAHGVVYL